MSGTWSPVQGSTIKIVVVVYQVITAMERHSAADFALLITLARSLSLFSGLKQAEFLLEFVPNISNSCSTS